MREVEWVRQALLVIERRLGEDERDPNRPDLFRVQRDALLAAFSLARAQTNAKLVVVPPAGRPDVRVYAEITRRRVRIFAIEASYDGGRTYVDPLTRYR